jgi:predicted kinase
VARVDLPGQSRSDDDVATPGRSANRESGDLGLRLARLAHSHPSSPRSSAAEIHPPRTSDGSDSPTETDPADRRDHERAADPALAETGPTDVDNRTADDEHAEHDAYVAAALADARKGGLTTDHEYVIDIKRRIWTAERSELHGEIVRDLYAKADAVPCEGKAILAGGLPGAGKTSVLNGVAGIDQSKYLMINPDDIKEELARRGMIPEVKGLSPMEASDLAHEESSDIAKRLAIRAYADNKNVIWDVTMSSVASTQRRIADLRSAGYQDAEGIFIDIPVEVSVRRAEGRHREGHEKYLDGRGLGGRYLPPDRIRSLADDEFGSINRKAFEQVKPEFSSWRIYDNSEDGRPARLVDDSGRHHDETEEGR